MLLRRLCTLAAFLLLGSVCHLGGAQTNAQVSATAESLFREGKDLMAANRYDEACAKFAGSFVLEETLGTLLNLANCHELAGKTASAWAEFLRANAMARSAGQDERQDVARERAQALEPKLMRLQIEVPEAARVRGLEVLRDQVPVEQAAWGSPIPVDPGTHTVVVQAPGKEPQTLEVELVAEGTTVLLEIPILKDEPPPAVMPEPAPPPPVAAAVAEPTLPAPVVVDSDPGSPQRMFGMILGSVGAAGLVAGTVFGALARNEWDAAKDEGCAGGSCPTLEGQRRSEDANDFAAYGSISVIGGGVLLASGIVLYLTAPRPHEEAGADVSSLGVGVDAAIARDGATLRVGGRF